MKTFKIILFVLSAIVTANPSMLHAQRVFEAEAGRAVALIGGGMALTGTGLYLESKITPLTKEQVNRLSRDDVNGFDRIATYNWSPKAGKISDYVRNACIVSPLAMFATEQVRKDALAYSLMYVETNLLTLGATMMAKGLAARTRPFVYNPDVPLNKKVGKQEARKSLFSGHTSIVFTNMVFLATVYSDYHPNSDWKPVVWAGSLGAASLVGILRVAAGKHFPTDVLTGAIVGGVIGYVVPQLHQPDKSNPAGESPPLQLALRIQF